MSSTSSTGSDKGERGDEQESTCTSLSEGGQWIYHPVIQPLTTEQCETLPALPVVGVQFQGVLYSSLLLFHTFLQCKYCYYSIHSQLYLTNFKTIYHLCTLN